MSLLSLLAKTGEVPKRVAARLHYAGDPAVLVSGLQVHSDNDLGTIQITAADPTNGNRAADLANADADELLGYLADRAQQNEQAVINQDAAQLQQLQKNINDLNSQIASKPPNATILTAQRDADIQIYSATYQRLQTLTAEPPPSSGLVTLQRATPVPIFASGGGTFTPPKSRSGRLFSGLMAGLLVGAGIAFALGRFDTRVRDREVAEQAFHLPVVAEVPAMARTSRGSQQILTLVDPLSEIAESYRSVRIAMQFMPSYVLSGIFSTPFAEGEEAVPAISIGGDPRVVLVTSPGAGEGKTTTVANLAVCFAEAGKSVLVLGCDFHHPDLHLFFGAREGPGLSELLQHQEGPITELPSDLVQSTRIPGVRIVTAGSILDSPTDLVARHRGLVPAARRLADVVLIDAAPMLVASQGPDLAQEVDTVIVVARCGQTRTTSARRCTELLARLGTPVKGVVLLGATGLLPRRSGSGYHWPDFSRRTPPASVAASNGHPPAGEQPAVPAARKD
jgi:capsular exopolysaccharide synthesis family protein